MSPAAADDLPRPEFTLIQLSDVHLLGGDELLQDGRIDTVANLRRALRAIEASGSPVHGLVLSGDLTDDGSPSAYRKLRAEVDPVAERLGCPVIYAMGNHDERSAFRAELLGEDPASDAPYDAVHWVDGLRVVVLDSSIPGFGDGRLDDTQLDWLAGQLAEPAPRGTVLVLHHPPLPSPVSPIHLLRLREPERLAEVLAGSDVRIVLSGHSHHTGTGTVAGIPVWITPALSYQFDALPPRDRLRGTDGTGISRIDVIDGAVTVTAIDLAADPTVFDFGHDEMVGMIRPITTRGADRS